MRNTLLSRLEKDHLKDMLQTAVSRKKAYICVLYHRVIDEAEPSCVVNWSKRVRKDSFIWQMRFIRTHCVPLPLTEMTERVRNGLPPDRFYVAVSFDDGYEDNYAEAFPVIQELGIPITVFLATGFIDEPTRLPWWDILERVACYNRGQITFAKDGEQLRFDLGRHTDRLRFLKTFSKLIKMNASDEELIVDWLRSHLPSGHRRTNEFMRWDQIMHMAAGPLVDLAPHTCWHSDLASADPSTYEEISASCERILQKTGSVVDLFSYPFGHYNRLGPERLFNHLAAQDIKAAFLATPGILSPRHHHYLLPRVPISGRDSQLLFLFKLLAPHLVHRLHQLMWRL